jgi:hypothetical protein
MSDVFERFAPIAARERSAMERGDSLRDVMARLRAEDIRAIEAHVVLRQIKRIPFNCAKGIVDGAYRGECPDLDLDDLALLASVPHHSKALWWLHHAIADAIVDRQPVMRLVPRDWPQPQEPGVQMRACGDTFADHRAALLSSIAEEPAWAREIEVVRDDDEVFEIRFVRVR